MSSPRPGRLAPRRNSARTMTRKTKSSGSPRIGAPPESVGNQLCVDQYRISDWTTPIARPAKHAMPNDVNPARRAAASAGTICSASVAESSVTRGATSTPSAPARTLASTVFAMRQAGGGEAGEHGRDLVLRGGSRRQAEARPAVQRRQHRGDDDHDPGEQEAVGRDDAAEDVTVSDGRMDGADCRAVAEDAGSQRPASTSRSPSDAASSRERRRVAERPEDRQLDHDAEHRQQTSVEDERRRGRELEARSSRS